MKYLWQIIVGYLLAVPLTSKVQLNIMDTQWENILTYIWIVGAFAIWSVIGIVVIMLVGAYASK